jgi:hypothetical protein
VEFVPHLGLGLFLKEVSPYDWDNPREDDFDRVLCEEALQRYPQNFASEIGQFVLGG